MVLEKNEIRLTPVRNCALPVEWDPLENVRCCHGTGLVAKHFAQSIGIYNPDRIKSVRIPLHVGDVDCIENGVPSTDDDTSRHVIVEYDAEDNAPPEIVRISRPKELVIAALTISVPP
jgi:hypothetical protein